MLPVLYSFRRCPYAIRARYVLASLGVSVSLREVVLKSKPEALLALGGRTTVPQLIDTDGRRYPESLDIIFWALSQSSCVEQAELIWPKSKRLQHRMRVWCSYNDRTFKYWLDRYKYADRYPEFRESDYRDKACIFLGRLDKRLGKTDYLFGDQASLSDMTIFPFIRQFSGVDCQWFESSQYDNVKRWLMRFTESNLFQNVVMPKIPQWVEGQEEVVFPSEK